MSARIYLVTDTATDKERLIRAGNQAQAIGFAARTRFAATVAKQDDLVNLVAAGVVVEEAGKEAKE